MKKTFFVVCGLMFGVLMTISMASAQTVTGSATSNLQMVSVSEVKEMPTNWGMWWTDFKHSVNLLFTNDPLEKAQKRLSFAEQKLKYAEYLATDSSDEKKQERATKMMEKANKYMEKVQEKKDQWLKVDTGEKLTNDVLSHQLKREQVMDRLEQK